MNRRFALIAAVCLFAALVPSISRAQAKPAGQRPLPRRPSSRPNGSRRSRERRLSSSSSSRREGQGRDPDQNQAPQHVERLDRAALGRRVLVHQMRYRLERDLQTQETAQPRRNHRVHRHRPVEAGPGWPEHADVQARQRDDQADQGQEAAIGTVQSSHGLFRSGPAGVGSGAWMIFGFRSARSSFDKASSPDKRAAWIRQIAEAPALMRSAIDGLNDRQFETPYRPGGWTVRQVVHHVPDSHLNAYCRYKLALTEDNPTIKPYDEAAWANIADTARTPPEVSLALLEALHARWVVLLESMTADRFRSAAPASRARRDHARLDAATLCVARTASRRARHGTAKARGMVGGRPTRAAKFHAENAESRTRTSAPLRSA